MVIHQIKLPWNAAKRQINNQVAEAKYLVLDAIQKAMEDNENIASNQSAGTELNLWLADIINVCLPEPLDHYP